ncbi:MAG: hypothetical protein M3440_09280 [Chloroflexota bacterium]|nr:hypothetical protein [Chloroflexota bacterium]
MTRRDHDTGPTGVTVDQLIDRMFPVVDEVLARLDGDEFTTTEFIELLLSVPEGKAAYDEAIRLWGEQERPTKMVIHGQIIPGALRRSRHVEWAGYAHGEADDYAVPAWWRLMHASS